MMPRPSPFDVPLEEEGGAVRIAARLARWQGTGALGYAERRLTMARRGGHVARADLFAAVCIIIADRGGVFSRSRA